MQYRHLGRTGLLVSEISLGTMNFGMTVDEDGSTPVLDAALDAGINFLDTADVYGGPQSPDMKQGYGISEEILGRWLQRSGARDQVVLATKLSQPMGLGPNDRKLSAYHIRRACEASLKRLQTDHIDLYEMHHVDRHTPWEEIWQAMDRLITDGKISYVGSSNFAGWQIAVGQAAADARHSLGLASEQSIYNLTARTIELEVIPALQHFGIGLIPYSPLGGGLLGGALRDATDGRRATDRLKQQIQQLRPQLERYEQLCDDLGEKPSDVALAWLLHQDAVSAAIVGSRTAEQLHGTLHAAEVHLDQAVLDQLDDIWPGPGGPAPEAYAW